MNTAEEIKRKSVETGLPLRMKQRRKELGITQEELAKKAMASQQTVTAIETGVTERSRFLPDIARTLGVTDEWLRSGVGPKEPVVAGRLAAAKNEGRAIRRIPLLDAGQAITPEEYIENWPESVDNVALYGADVARYGNASFAIQVGSSERSLLSGDSPFQARDLLICDTDATPEPGDYVIAAIEGEDRIQTGQLRINSDGGREVVTPNEMWPNFVLRKENEDRIVAVICEVRRTIRD